MSEQLERIEQKIDKVTEKISGIDAILAAQHESLKEHIRRTTIIEETIAPSNIVKWISVLFGVIATFLACLKFLWKV